MTSPFRIFLPLLAIFLPLGAPGATARLPLRFDKMPLGNVVRILSARYGGATVTIAAHATAPISGNFAGLKLRAALEKAASQAGLEVAAVGKDESAGYILRLPVKKHSAAPDSSFALAVAAGRRAALLRRREQLMREGEELAPDPPSP